MITDTFCTISENLKKSILSKKQILDSLRPFPNDVLAKLREQMNLEWTYNSNAIEGNTLTLQETEIVLKRGITIGNKNLREHFEALNHDEAVRFLEGFVDRKKYHRVLRKADMDKPQEFVDFIAKAIERSLVIYLEALKPCEAQKTSEGYILLSEAAKYSKYSKEYLSLLARKGKLPAVKFEKNWMTTLEAVKEYEKQNQ